MIPLVQDLPPVLVMLMASFIAWQTRMHAMARTKWRTRQLNEAADLLELHAKSLERFLDDEAAPDELKKLLVAFSDTMGERETVEKLTEWASARPFQQPADTEEMRAIS